MPVVDSVYCQAIFIPSCKIHGGFFMEENKKAQEILTDEVIEKTERKIGYTFKNKDLLIQAFVRKSYSHECQNFLEDNEILEFVGDKALDFIIVKMLVRRYGYFKDADFVKELSESKNIRLYNCFESSRTEGDLTEIKIKLVESKMLASAIEKTGFHNYLVMGKGDIKNNAQNEAHIKEDLFEALLGAIALDSNWNTDALEKAVVNLLNPEHYLENGFDDENYVGYVQAWWQKTYSGALPPYEIKESDAFYCSLKIQEHPQFFKGAFKDEFFGEGKSKKEAIFHTAKQVYEFLQTSESSSKLISDLVGDPDPERSINQLQELWQKGYISKPMYNFSEGEKSSSGNSTWFCRCFIESANIEENIGNDTKKQAQKGAAFLILLKLKEQKLQKIEGEKV